MAYSYNRPDFGFGGLNEDLVFLKLDAATAKRVLRRLFVDERDAPENPRHVQGAAGP